MNLKKRKLQNARNYSRGIKDPRDSHRIIARCSISISKVQTRECENTDVRVKLSCPSSIKLYNLPSVELNFDLNSNSGKQDSIVRCCKRRNLKSTVVLFPVFNAFTIVPYKCPSLSFLSTVSSARLAISTILPKYAPFNDTREYLRKHHYVRRIPVIPRSAFYSWASPARNNQRGPSRGCGKSHLRFRPSFA